MKLQWQINISQLYLSFEERIVKMNVDIDEIPFASLDSLSERYDIFLIDQYGVLRDDVSAYPRSIETLQYLKSNGKTVIIVSNSGRSSQYNAERFVNLGFERGSFDYFVTSGETAFWLISSKKVFSLDRGSVCFTISSGNDNNLAERLGLAVTENPNDADLLIISGSDPEHVPLLEYRNKLTRMALRNVPCVCTNPDIHKISGGTLLPAAGALANAYQDMGGKVHWIGKPMREIYELALYLSGKPDRERVVCVGDSIEHDIAGAAAMGLDSVLVSTGIMANMSPSEASVRMKKKGVRPTFRMEAFG